jgi:hypothetical protein
MYHGDATLDFAFTLQLAEHRGQRLRRLVRLNEMPEGIGKRRRHVIEPGRGGRGHDHRVAVLVDDRRRRKVHVGGVRTQDHIDLVLLNQAVGELEQFVRLSLIVVLDKFDRDLLAELLQFDAARVVHALLP